VHPRDALLFSLALGTGLRLAELVGFDVGDAFFPEGPTISFDLAVELVAMIGLPGRFITVSAGTVYEIWSRKAPAPHRP
jgi:site-specific recombinase XerC